MTLSSIFITWSSKLFLPWIFSYLNMRHHCSKYGIIGEVNFFLPPLLGQHNKIKPYNTSLLSNCLVFFVVIWNSLLFPLPLIVIFLSFTHIPFMYYLVFMDLMYKVKLIFIVHHITPYPKHIP